MKVAFAMVLVGAGTSFPVLGSTIATASVQTYIDGAPTMCRMQSTGSPVVCTTVFFNANATATASSVAAYGDLAVNETVFNNSGAAHAQASVEASFDQQLFLPGSGSGAMAKFVIDLSGTRLTDYYGVEPIGEIGGHPLCAVHLGIKVVTLTLTPMILT